jgi:hypothetical protein
VRGILSALLANANAEKEKRMRMGDGRKSRVN